MEAKAPKTSRLFQATAVESKDDIEEKLERSYQVLQATTGGLSDKDAHDAINKALVKEKGYEEVSLGLLVTILAEPANAAKAYRDLTLISHDGFGLVLNNLSQLVLERYLRFTDVVKNQVVWLLREMIKNAVNSVDTLCWNLLRHAAGGDISPKNISLVENLLDVLVEYRSWLDKFPFLIASVVYTYLRLIEDHNAPYLATLRQKEVTFLVSLIRDRFNDCMAIGRDLVRLLQNVARIPEFELLWRDILSAPRNLSPQFTGILQLMHTRTSRRYLQSRLTPDMERKLVFFTSQVRFGNHKRYQDWFQRQYLATPESQSLRCDIIRFIVGVIHPTNELLCSDIIPRWAVIGWLLTTCTSSVAVSNAKLALFYDWLFYDSDRDNIMNIEPAILVMHHSMRSHPAVSATLLDFLCRIIPNFYQPFTDKVRTGIFTSLRQILDKRVLPSLIPLFDNAKLDPDLRGMVRETFKEFCTNPVPETSANTTANTTPNTTAAKSDQSLLQPGDFMSAASAATTTVTPTAAHKYEDSDGEQQPSAHNSRLNNLATAPANNHVLLMDTEPAFSDDEEDQPLTIHALEHGSESDDDDDDIPLSKVRLKEKTQDKLDDSIEGPLGETLTRLQQEQQPEKKCEAMATFLEQLLTYETDDESLPVIAKLVCNSMDEFVFPDSVTHEALLSSLNHPLFVLFNALYLKQDDTTLLYRLLVEMRGYRASLGYLLLYFLKVQLRTENHNRKEDQHHHNTRPNSLKVGVYKEYCQMADKKVDSCLYDDLVACHVNDTRLMMWIAPNLFRDFKQQLVNNGPIIRVVLSAIDSRQLQTLVGKVLQGHLVILRSENLQPLLKASLLWESIEQFFFWQLIHAHDISIDTVLPLITQLDYEQHSEALTEMTLMLKQQRPNADYIKYLFSRDVSDTGDLFIFTIIKYWIDEYIDKLAELIASLLTTRYPSTSPNKRKRTGGSKPLGGITSVTPSADTVLGHLEQLRIICEKHDCKALFCYDSMQRALTVAMNNSSDSQKRAFGQLFALLEEEEEVSVTKSRSQGRGRKPAAAKAAPPAATTTTNKRQAATAVTTTRDISDSSEESSEEEEIVKPKHAKKRKKVIDDSD